MRAAGGDSLDTTLQGSFLSGFSLPPSERWFRLVLCSVERAGIPAPTGRVYFVLGWVSGVRSVPVERLGPMAPLGGDPRLVLLFSGKRKSGKDFVTQRLQSRCPRVQGCRRKGCYRKMGMTEGAR